MRKTNIELEKDIFRKKYQEKIDRLLVEVKSLDETIKYLEERKMVLLSRINQQHINIERLDEVDS